MVMYKGYNTVVLYQDETSYGTTGTGSANVIKGRLQSVNIEKSNSTIRLAGLGEGRNQEFHGYGNFEGTWSMDFHPADFEFLKYGIGTKSGDGNTLSPYIIEETTDLDSTTLTINSLDTVSDKETLTGCMINTIGIDLNLGQPVSVSLEGFYQKPTNATTTTSFTKDTTKPWIFSQGTFKWNDSAVARVQSISIKINNQYNPDDGRQIGSRFIEDVAPGIRTYDWTAVVKMTDTIATTLRDHFYGTTNTPNTGVADAEPTFYDLKLELSEGSASGDRNAVISIEDASIIDISKPITISDNVVELTINGTAKRGETSSTKNIPIKWWTTT